MAQRQQRRRHDARAVAAMHALQAAMPTEVVFSQDQVSCGTTPVPCLVGVNLIGSEVKVCSDAHEEARRAFAGAHCIAYKHYTYVLCFYRERTGTLSWGPWQVLSIHVAPDADMEEVAHALRQSAVRFEIIES